MAKCLGMQRKGGASNLEVIRVDSYSSIPASSANGKLYIITPDAIPSDLNGIMWAGDLPTLRAEGSALQNGDVCILGGMKSQTPVQVLPGYWVYPRAAYQRVSGAWVQKVAYIRFAGNLVLLAYYLYKNGVVSGVGAWGFWDSAGLSGTLLTLSCSSTSTTGFTQCPLAIDFTDLHTVRFLNRRYVEYYAVPAVMAVSRLYGGGNVYNTLIASVAMSYNSAFTETSLDVSGVEGIGYIGAYAVYDGNARGSQIQDVLFE